MFFFNSNLTQSFAQLSRRNHVSSKCYVVGFEVRFLSVGERITVKIPQIQIWLNNMEHTRKNYHPWSAVAMGPNPNPCLRPFFRWYLWVKEESRECQDPQFSTGTLYCIHDHHSFYQHGFNDEADSVYYRTSTQDLFRLFNLYDIFIIN